MKEQMNHLIEKAKHIRLMIFDVDGILTSGTLTYSTQGIEVKDFHVLDGQGMKLLKKTGVEIAIITSCRSQVIKKRMEDLDIEHVFIGQQDKFPIYENLKKKLKLSDDQIAYMGDDLPDLPMLTRVQLAITVPNAPAIIQKYSHWITQAQGGRGAAREACDFIMQAQGTYETIINSFLKDHFQKG